MPRRSERAEHQDADDLIVHDQGPDDAGLDPESVEPLAVAGRRRGQLGELREDHGFPGLEDPRDRPGERRRRLGVCDSRAPLADPLVGAHERIGRLPLQHRGPVSAQEVGDPPERGLDPVVHGLREDSGQGRRQLGDERLEGVATSDGEVRVLSGQGVRDDLGNQAESVDHRRRPLAFPAEIPNAEGANGRASHDEGQDHGGPGARPLDEGAIARGFRREVAQACEEHGLLLLEHAFGHPGEHILGNERGSGGGREPRANPLMGHLKVAVSPLGDRAPIKIECGGDSAERGLDVAVDGLGGDVDECRRKLGGQVLERGLRDDGRPRSAGRLRRDRAPVRSLVDHRDVFGPSFERRHPLDGTYSRDRPRHSSPRHVAAAGRGHDPSPADASLPTPGRFPWSCKELAG